MSAENMHGLGRMHTIGLQHDDGGAGGALHLLHQVQLAAARQQLLLQLVTELVRADLHTRS